MNRYHFSCTGPPLGIAGKANEYSCPFCLCIESGALSRNGGQALVDHFILKFQIGWKKVVFCFSNIGTICHRYVEEIVLS